jgi:hypothetical protein
MPRLKQYDKGYLEGQLDSAENELWALQTILSQMTEQPHKGDLIIIRIKETEDFLLENGRSTETE